MYVLVNKEHNATVFLSGRQEIKKAGICSNEQVVVHPHAIYDFADMNSVFVDKIWSAARIANINCLFEGFDTRRFDQSACSAFITAS